MKSGLLNIDSSAWIFYATMSAVAIIMNAISDEHIL